MTTVLRHPTAVRVRSDEELVARVRAGDARAFDELHARYAPRLVVFARGLLGGAHHDAEEVVQDAFVRALAALRADDRAIAVSAWLHTIVRNRAVDVLRRPRRTTDLEPLAAVLHDRSAGGGDPHGVVVRREDLRALVADLHALPERQRTALVLHELGGEPHEAIARRLHVSAGGSKALVSRARSGLARAREAA